MKTNEEILKEIKTKYLFALHMRSYWQLEESRYLTNNNKTKAKISHEFVNQYQTRMDTLQEIYMIVSGLDLFTAINELRKDAE